MSLLTRKRVFAADVESTIGTAATVSTSQGAFNVYDFKCQPTIDFAEREGQSAFSRLTGVVGARMGTATFKTHLTTATSIQVWMSILLRACGYVNTTGTLSPVTTPAQDSGSSTATCITIAGYQDGLLKKLHGCAGTVVFTFEAGKPAMAEWTFQGVWNAPTDVSIIAPTYPTEEPLRFSGTCTLGGTALKISKMTIDMGNVITPLHSPSTASGYKNFCITDRRITGSFDPESDLVANKDWYGIWIARTEAALSIIMTDSAAKTLTFAAPKLQLMNVQEGDRSGIQTEDINFQLSRSAVGGNDELTIAFA